MKISYKKLSRLLVIITEHLKFFLFCPLKVKRYIILPLTYRKTDTVQNNLL